MISGSLLNRRAKRMSRSHTFPLCLRSSIRATRRFFRQMGPGLYGAGADIRVCSYSVMGFVWSGKFGGLASLDKGRHVSGDKDTTECWQPRYIQLIRRFWPHRRKGWYQCRLSWVRKAARLRMLVLLYNKGWAAGKGRKLGCSQRRIYSSQPCEV
jgi:hypothetical protein